MSIDKLIGESNGRNNILAFKVQGRVVEAGGMKIAEHTLAFAGSLNFKYFEDWKAFKMFENSRKILSLCD